MRKIKTDGSLAYYFCNVLSGCVKTGADGQPTGEGFVYNFLVLPMSNVLILSITLIELWLGDYFYHHYCTDHYFTVRLTSIEKSFIQTQAIKPQVDVAQAK